MSKKPKIGITMGDPASIGPEIAVKAFSEKSIYEICDPLLIGNAEVLNSNIKLLESRLRVNKISKVDDAEFRYGTIDLFNLANVDITVLEPGKVSAMCGEAAFGNVITAIAGHRGAD